MRQLFIFGIVFGIVHRYDGINDFFSNLYIYLDNYIIIIYIPLILVHP